ncbi:MAG: UbiH/UbiF/VisC/COQ6 family ubiquinone biosynthesis hydroxylase [Pseudomonadota bacterium]
MSRSTDIVIAGAGITGLTAALGLSAVGIPSTLIDPARSHSTRVSAFDGRAYAISRSSQNLLNAVGVWEGIASNATEISVIAVTTGKYGEGASPLFVHFDAADGADRDFGYMVEERHLRSALAKAVSKSSLISLAFGAGVEGFESAVNGLRLNLDNGETLSTKLLLGADGRRTKIPDAMGLKRLHWDYPQSAIVCAVEHVDPHNGVAHQFFAPNGPLAILPLGTHRASLVWTETHERADMLMQLPQAAFLKELKQAFGDFLGQLNLISKPVAFPLALSALYEPVADRVAMLGDAAHGIHPLAGQGLNLGFSDVAALVEVLVDAKRRGEDISNLAVLRRYAAWRTTDTFAMSAATDGLNRLFSTKFGMPEFVPQLGMALAKASAPFRDAMMDHASGMKQSAPKLSKGILP